MQGWELMCLILAVAGNDVGGRLPRAWQEPPVPARPSLVSVCREETALCLVGGGVEPTSGLR